MLTCLRGFLSPIPSPLTWSPIQCLENPFSSFPNPLILPVSLAASSRKASLMLFRPLANTPRLWPTAGLTGSLQGLKEAERNPSLGLCSLDTWHKGEPTWPAF